MSDSIDIARLQDLTIIYIFSRDQSFVVLENLGLNL